MDSDKKTDGSGRNLTHQKNDEICIGENAKVTQHDPEFENADEGDNEEHLESPHIPILDVNFTKNNARICHSESVLKSHTGYQPRYSFYPFDRNCTKQQRILNSCDQVDLQTLEHGQELYTQFLYIVSSHFIF